MESSSAHQHKRNKSSVRSLLHRVSSKQDAAVNSDTDDQASNPASSQTSITSPPAASVHASRSSIQGPRHRPHLSTTMSNSNATSSEVLAPPYAAQSPSSPTAKGASIEQSVRLFRIFEALRNGDTAAISKAIREEASTQGGARQSTSSVSSLSTARLEGTTILHLAIQCAELPVIEFVLSNVGAGIDLNGRDRDGNTPLHLAAQLGRAPVVKMLLDQSGINDSLTNYHGQTPLDLARTPDIFQQLQLTRSIFIDTNVKKIQELALQGDYKSLEAVLTDPRVQTTLDVNGPELATDPSTIETGGTLLHEAARKKDTQLCQLLLLNGADPFRRDRKGKLPHEVTKDDKTKAILKKSPAAAAAQRGIQERTILGAAAQAAGPASAEVALGSKESREMKGYLKKWTNYTGGYKLRWFVLEDGVLSYYKHQDDIGSACRGAINMRIAKLHMDPQDKLRFEIHGKSSVKYHLKANHQVEAKRWFWALNNAIQWSKDEAREEEKRQTRETEALRQAKTEQATKESDAMSVVSSKPNGRNSVLSPTGSGALGVPQTGSRTGPSTTEDDDLGNSAYDASLGGEDASRYESRSRTGKSIGGDLDDDDDYGDDVSSDQAKPVSKDAFNITAQSVKLQLDLLAQVSAALQAEKAKNPSMAISDPAAAQAFASYEAAVSSLKGLVGDLFRIARDRDAYWQYRLDREANVRRMWEESMAKVAREQEELENRIGESEDKRKRTKKALRDALQGLQTGEPSKVKSAIADTEAIAEVEEPAEEKATRSRNNSVTRPNLAELAQLSDSESDDEEFFDAIQEGEVEIVETLPVTSPPAYEGDEKPPTMDLREAKSAEIIPSFKGYEDPVRTRLKLDEDNRPKISLWGILKSMIGKDMTKMTLPVSFNEPTSLLQRVAEDMEYVDLLDIAAERMDSCERMVYVAAFAASEYASTIGRVAKPFNPLLGETFEYCRPDKGFRFFVEQVSHHPPIGAAWAESAKWDYYGESAVRSKFYGKSFDINPLGTWFLRLRPASGGEELYTWKKVTSSVIGIITGNPTVDNYGLMEIKNHTTGEVCLLDFKPRGWKASSAYQVAGKVVGSDGQTRWSIGGRWNDKIYARLTPGYEDGDNVGQKDKQATLIWQCHERPTGIPFNLTPFVLTLNDLPDRLKPILAPTDTRLRPDQRAMEDGEYDFAATEKNRVEEKQRAKRREREAAGEEFEPHWFSKARDEVTGEEYWKFNGEYWKMREKVANGEGSWEGCEDIF
ncbi:Oxysterol-binding protein [Lasiodiplodia theobromae]|uniref:Oxysterol-binding protein-like protein n=1 Tax=Lasiodiplodia theobromae TaxID=45133 RepID=A0A5N5DIB0_9PEZI|nr:Oxysterol-binding protein [Lasiodiplodia theobromae]KAB2577609.1 Oxysterol-binding protein-like protein [Lasiodiplodia theobromae]KAF4535653.1 Oxysterol-binding protein [Lasiodiplodia theobromae]KAF9638938.1 Oxysterol-binding protein [Lasiodiplodia theobromae]